MIHNFSGRVITAASVRKAEKAHAELWVGHKLGKKDPPPTRFRVDTLILGKPAGKLLVELDVHGVMTPVGLAEL